jgi:hypothetical protein
MTLVQLSIGLGLALAAVRCFPVEPAHAKAPAPPEVTIYGPVECRTQSKCTDTACYTWTICKRRICDANGCRTEERWL